MLLSDVQGGSYQFFRDKHTLIQFLLGPFSYNHVVHLDRMLNFDNVFLFLVTDMGLFTYPFRV